MLSATWKSRELGNATLNLLCRSFRPVDKLDRVFLAGPVEVSGEFVVLAGLQFGEQLPERSAEGRFLDENVKGRTTFLRMLE